MANDILIFTDNHNNKLYCNAFTRISKWDDKRFQVNKIFRIYYQTGSGANVKKLDLGTARLVTRRKIPIENLTELACRLDTGYGLEDTKRMISRIWKDKAQILVLACFVWEQRHPIRVPLRGIVGKTFRDDAKARKIRKESEFRLKNIQDKYADRSTLITGDKEEAPDAGS